MKIAHHYAQVSLPLPHTSLVFVKNLILRDRPTSVKCERERRRRESFAEGDETPRSGIDYLKISGAKLLQILHKFCCCCGKALFH